MALITLQVGLDKPGNVYRLVRAMEAVPSSQGPDVCYLMLRAVVRYGDSEEDREIFCIAMQYSDTLGEFVNVSQPAHVALEDIDELQVRFAAFVHAHR
jgi:hypothetical protein